MAKRVFIIAMMVLALGSLRVGAQTFFYGVKAGLNYSYATQREGSMGKVGGDFGALAGYEFSNSFALQLEAMYSFDGYMSAPQKTVSGEEIKGDKINIDYLKIPLTAKFYLINGLNIEAGVSLNLLTSALLNTKTLGGINTVGVSLPIGVAYEFNRHLELGVRWNIGLSPFDSRYKGTLNTLSLNLAWRF